MNLPIEPKTERDRLEARLTEAKRIAMSMRQAPGESPAEFFGRKEAMQAWIENLKEMLRTLERAE